MRDKKGFILIETIITVVILITTLVLVYSSYSGLIRSEKKKLYYDDIAYIYKTEMIKEYILKHMDVPLFKDETNENEYYIFGYGTEIEGKPLFNDEEYNNAEEIFENENIEMLIYAKTATFNNFKSTINDLDNPLITDSLKEYIKTINISKDNTNNSILISVIKEYKNGKKIDGDITYEECIKINNTMACEEANYYSWVYLW